MSCVVPHAEPASDESVLQPGAQISGLRRPSAVGPAPPVQTVPWFGVSPSLPTAVQFLAFFFGQEVHQGLMAGGAAVGADTFSQASPSTRAYCEASRSESNEGVNRMTRSCEALPRPLRMDTAARNRPS